MKDRPAPDPAPDVNARIARAVRGLRAERGLTLDALAAKCEVSRSMISLIERGESSPTAVVLDRIATGLGVPLVVLFGEAADSSDPISRGADRTSWRDPGSGYVRRTVSPSGYPSPLRISEIVLPAGKSVAFETSPREIGIHQQVWVLEGTLEVALGRVTHRLAADDCLAMRVDQPTTFRNPTRRRVRYVVVVSSERGSAPTR